ncbi:MAG: polyphenol oxidase family protein [Candidatus Sumerlaeaceae bacterium]|nr:polyphenol oxidase family protein [Candidatus Sumerlaeaceae bacterium]
MQLRHWRRSTPTTMITFDWLEQHAPVIAFMTGREEGDCGWEGCASGSRATCLAQAPIPSERLVALRQCHGDRIVVVQPQDAGRGSVDRASALADADGLISWESNLPLAINVADCVPVFLAGPGVCGLVHAGREGTAQHIAEKAVRELAEHDVLPESLYALLGPSAGPCCYAVSPEMRANSVASGVSARGDHLDLWDTNYRQLVGAGVPAEHIHVSGICTICQPGFFSYRGDATTARNMAVIMRRSGL